MTRRNSLLGNIRLKVSRPVSACLRCRTAKVKVRERRRCDMSSPRPITNTKQCDGKLPACTACEKANRQQDCSLATEANKEGRERNYVAALEARKEQLERHLAYAQSRKASIAQRETEDPASIMPSTDANGRKTSLDTIREAMLQKASRKRENSDVNTLVSEFGYMSINAAAGGLDATDSSSDDMTFAKLVLAVASNDPLPTPTTSRWPAEPTARTLVEKYLDNIYPLYPILPDDSINALLTKIYEQPDTDVQGSERWVFWMVLAIASAAQSRSSADDYYTNAVQFVSRAMAYADRALAIGTKTQLPALFLLTQYSMLDPAHFDSWHLMGFTCRVLVDLGFHQDIVRPHPAELDVRRRTFYSIYALDRAISMVYARPFSFPDRAISVGLPKPQPRESDYLFKLRRLQSEWYQALVQSGNEPMPDAEDYIWTKCQEMRNWALSLPQDLRPNIREMLDLDIHYSYVYCLAPLPRAPSITLYAKALIFEHTISFITSIYAIVHDARRPQAFYTFHDALRVYFMGAQLVVVLREAQDELLSGQQIPPPLIAPWQPAIPLPLPPPAEGVDQTLRSLEALGKVEEILKTWGLRWVYAQELLQAYEMMSKDVMDALTARNESLAVSHEQNSFAGNQDQDQFPGNHDQDSFPDNQEHNSFAGAEMLSQGQ
ncbi:fungal-specific transcription factor domain-containing protein [Echria macrotheca]|uniref:Fungal-specific transcription factor domain-containing protein n=1 Tax=Echria macrotheca TaxID=438768 RepID=A0AAJ0BLS5_9PEZI|nr:fungal-specific transcription factor domain-containing protein [Echria macrotheca]